MSCFVQLFHLLFWRNKTSIDKAILKISTHTCLFHNQPLRFQGDYLLELQATAKTISAGTKNVPFLNQTTTILSINLITTLYDCNHSNQKNCVNPLSRNWVTSVTAWNRPAVSWRGGQSNWVNPSQGCFVQKFYFEQIRFNIDHKTLGVHIV